MIILDFYPAPKEQPMPRAIAENCGKFFAVGDHILALPEWRLIQCISIQEGGKGAEYRWLYVDTGRTYGRTGDPLIDERHAPEYQWYLAEVGADVRRK